MSKRPKIFPGDIITNKNKSHLYRSPYKDYMFGKTDFNDFKKGTAFLVLSINYVKQNTEEEEKGYFQFCILQNDTKYYFEVDNEEQFLGKYSKILL